MLVALTKRSAARLNSSSLPPVSSRYEPRTGVSARNCLRTEHHGSSNSSRCESANPPRIFRFSLVRAILRDNRSVFSRIQDTQRRRLAISINPLPQKPYTLAPRESALDGCMRDTHNLCTHRLQTTLIEAEAELFAEWWSSGAAFAVGNCGTEPRAGTP
jgi:hypothetical protein